MDKIEEIRGRLHRALDRRDEGKILEISRELDAEIIRFYESTVHKIPPQGGGSHKIINNIERR